MLVKIAVLFLLGMLLIAMIGRAVLPRAFRAAAARAPVPCPSCGRYPIGKGPCPCKAGRKV